MAVDLAGVFQLVESVSHRDQADAGQSGQLGRTRQFVTAGQIVLGDEIEDPVIDVQIAKFPFLAILGCDLSLPLSQSHYPGISVDKLVPAPGWTTAFGQQCMAVILRTTS
nr:hypothetical protein [Mesorhizobium amorphae]